MEEDKSKLYLENVNYIFNQLIKNKIQWLGRNIWKSIRTKKYRV